MSVTIYPKLLITPFPLVKNIHNTMILRLKINAVNICPSSWHTFSKKWKNPISRHSSTIMRCMSMKLLGKLWLSHRCPTGLVLLYISIIGKTVNSLAKNWAFSCNNWNHIPSIHILIQCNGRRPCEPFIFLIFYFLENTEKTLRRHWPFTLYIKRISEMSAMSCK